MPQPPPRPVVVPQSLPKLKEPAKAPVVELKPASPKRLRDDPNVTENQIVQVPPRLNIFKDSNLLKDIKATADANAQEEVKESNTIYSKLAQNLIDDKLDQDE